MNVAFPRIASVTARNRICICVANVAVLPIKPTPHFSILMKTVVAGLLPAAAVVEFYSVLRE
jgi:hypothetical protein